MKLLLTSGGISNASIKRALVDLLGKHIHEANALCIPTAEYGHPWCTPQSAWQFIAGQNLGWKSVGLLELTALPSIGPERWISWVQDADVLLVDGGDAMYLAHWLRQSGLADLFPELPNMVWVGVSAGSMVMTPRIGKEFVNWPSPGGHDETLGLVDFSIFPHLGVFPQNSLPHAEQWAASMTGPCYALDDQSAIQVVGNHVEVISEGHWQLFRGNEHD